MLSSQHAGPVGCWKWFIRGMKFCCLLELRHPQAANWWWDRSHCPGGAGWGRTRIFAALFPNAKAYPCTSVPRINGPFWVYDHSENTYLNFRDLNNQEKKLVPCCLSFTAIPIRAVMHTVCMYRHVLRHFYYLFGILPMSLMIIKSSTLFEINVSQLNSLGVFCI